MGDILLTTPVLSALKEKYPNTQIDYLIKQNYADAVKYHPAVTKLLIYDKENLNTLIKELKSEDYDLVLDLQNNFRSRKISKTLGAVTHRYNKPTIKKILLVKFKVNLLKESKPISQRYSDTLKGLMLDGHRMSLIYPGDTRTQLKENNYIGFCPGSKHFDRPGI